MGKLLIIKGADFSANAIEDSSKYLARGFIGNTGSDIDSIVRSGQQQTTSVQRKFVIFVKNIVTGELFSTDKSTVFVPEGYYYRPCVVSSNMSKTIRLNDTILSTGVYITEAEIYSMLNADKSNYPFYGINISNGSSAYASTEFTIDDALSAGVMIHL